MTTAARSSSSSANRRGLVQRFTAKAGPLPVWAWAVLILVVGYVVYRLSGAGSSSSSGTADTSSSDTSTSSTDNTGSPGTGSAADNSEVLAGLSGLQGSVDSLTGLVQSSPAFYGDGSGDSGSGSSVPNDGSGGNDPTTTPPPTRAQPPTPARPSAHPPAPAKHRYYTYKPGTKGHAKDTAPAKGPAGTKLHFAKGKGYYYA